MEHVQENLSVLSNRLNVLILQGTEQEEENAHRYNNCPPELKSLVLAGRKEKNEKIESGMPCFSRTELRIKVSKTEIQIKGVTEVME